MQTLGFVTRALLLLLVLGTSSTTAVNANVSEHTSSSSSSNNEVQSSPPEYRVASHTAAPLHAAISDAATTVNATTTATTTVSSDNNNNSSTGAAAAATAPAPLSATDAAWVHDTAQLAQLIYELDGAQPGVTALDITQVGRPPAVQAYTELPFGQTFELTYNFSAPEYLESLTGSLPKQARQQIVIALHSPGFVQERKTPMFAALLAHQRPRMIVMAATHPASSLPFYHALNVTAPHQHRLDPSYNPRHLLHYWNNKLCVDGYALNVYKTVVARNALAQRPLHHNTYRLLSFRLAIYEAADMYGSTSVDHDAVRLASMSVHDPLLSLHFSRLVHDSERQAILDEHDEYRYVVHKAQTELLSRQLSARSGLSSSCRKTHAPGDIRICDASTDRPVHLCALSIAPEVVVDSKLRADLWMQLYRDQWHDKLAVLMARDLEQQCDRIKAADDVSVATLQTVTIENNEFLRVFLHLLAQTDFRPHRRHQYRLLHDQHRLSILVRLSDVGSTDVYLHDSLALWSFLMLYNPMSRHQVPLVRLYDRDVLLTAAWLSNLYSAGLEGLISYAPTLRWLRRYVVGVDPRHRALADSVFGGTYDWVLDYETGFHLMNAPSGYFAISYIDADQDRWYKHGINHMLSNVLRAPLIREWSRERFPVARPDARGRPRIAVISKFWSGSHASVRILRGTLAALKPHASITLVLLDALEQVEWKEYFDDLHVVRCMPNVDLYADDVNWIVEQNFAMVYYLDVGMYAYSTHLANKRLARIQIASYGHSVSTFGSKIDYWCCGGSEVELVYGGTYGAVAANGTGMSTYVVDGLVRAPNYSETLVLVPGMGAVHDRPTWNPAVPRSSIPPNCTRSDPFIINLGWSMPKINATQLANLGRIVAGTTCFVQFRFFVGEPYISEFTILKSALEFVPADRMIFTPRVQSHDYLSWFQRGHLMLDSHHHGSCNTAVDALVTHTPSVLYEGVRWNNRIAPAMFRRAGMAEHIATNDDELVTKTLQLVNNATYWSATVQRLAALDLDSLFFSKRTDDADMYAAAFMYLHAHHERIQQSSTSVGDDGVTPLRLGPPPVLRLKVVTDPVTHAMTASLLATS